MDFIKLYEELNELDEDILEESDKEFGIYKKAFVNLILAKTLSIATKGNKNYSHELTYIGKKRDGVELGGAQGSAGHNVIESIISYLRNKINVLYDKLDDLVAEQEANGVVDLEAEKQINNEIDKCANLIKACQTFAAYATGNDKLYRINTRDSKNRPTISSMNLDIDDAIKLINNFADDQKLIDDADGSVLKAIKDLQNAALDFTTKSNGHGGETYWRIPCVLHHINGNHDDNAPVKGVGNSYYVLAESNKVERDENGKVINAHLEEIPSIGNYVLIEAPTPAEADNAHLLVHAIAIMKYLANLTNDGGFADLKKFLEGLDTKATFYYITNNGKIKATSLVGFLYAEDRAKATETPLDALAKKENIFKGIYKTDGKADTNE